MKKRSSIFFLFFVLLSSIIIYNIFSNSITYSVSKKYVENLENNFKNETSEDKNIEIVVSRYNENLKWLSEEPYNKYSTIVYNKGENNDFEKAENIKSIFDLSNVGRESHTYLYHIITNYDNLADVTVFLPGSIDTQMKHEKSNAMMSQLETHKDTIIPGKMIDNVRDYFYDLSLNTYDTTHDENAKLNSEKKLSASKIRPFGKWYDYHFHDIKSPIFPGWCIFAISKKDIIKKPKSYYENLIKEVNQISNPETGHYFERSWYAVFYPYDNLKTIEWWW
jgi:hypothetical protein